MTEISVIILLRVHDLYQTDPRNWFILVAQIVREIVTLSLLRVQTRAEKKNTFSVTLGTTPNIKHK